MVTLLYGNELFSEYLHITGKDPSLSERTILWDWANRAIIPLHPVLGVGYRAFRVESNPYAEELVRIFGIGSKIHFHNQWYEAAVELGYVGLSISFVTFLVMMITLTRWAIRFQSPESCFYLGLATYTAIRTYVEVDLFAPFMFGFVLLIVGYLHAKIALKKQMRKLGGGGRRVTWRSQRIAAIMTALVAVAVWHGPALAKTLYSASSGSDTNTCVSVDTPCRSIVKVNSTTYAPGNSILLHGGDNFSGCVVLDLSERAHRRIRCACHHDRFLRYRPGDPVIDLPWPPRPAHNRCRQRSYDRKPHCCPVRMPKPPTGILVQNGSPPGIVDTIIVKDNEISGFTASGPSQYGAEVFITGYAMNGRCGALRNIRSSITNYMAPKGRSASMTTASLDTAAARILRT